MMHTTVIAQSRGGMLALVCVFVVAFYLMPKSPRHYLGFLVACLVALRLGWGALERFGTVFQDSAEALDKTGGHRLTLWGNCLDAMLRQPLFGVGPNHWPLIVTRYGWPEGKLGHSLWLQDGAELGIPALVFLLLFYMICIWRLWPIARGKVAVWDPWLQDCARMVIAAIVGFMISAQFVSLHGLETPFHIVMIGCVALKFASMPPPDKEGLASGELNEHVLEHASGA
jgi:O-antigen ligase